MSEEPKPQAAYGPQYAAYGQPPFGGQPWPPGAAPQGEAWQPPPGAPYSAHLPPPPPPPYWAYMAPPPWAYAPPPPWHAAHHWPAPPAPAAGGPLAALLQKFGLDKLGLTDGDFWKGALVGAAAVLLLNSDALRSLLPQGAGHGEEAGRDDLQGLSEALEAVKAELQAARATAAANEEKKA